MKRKVKFQEGGAVKEPSPRSRQLRERMSRMSREGGRLRAAERARERQVAERAAERAAAAERRASQSADAELSRQPAAYESDRRRNIGPQAGRPDFTTDPQGTTRRGAATGRELSPVRQSMQRAMTEMVTPRQMPLGSPRPRVGGNLATMGGAVAMGLAEPMANYARGYMERRGAEADARREANLQAFRDQQQTAPADGPAAGSMMSAPSAPRTAPRPAARPAPARPRVREMSADELNEMELRIRRAERQMEEDEARRIARERPPALVDIGAASARERGEQVGPPGQYNMKKGGKVPAPKKMMKGGIVAKPKSKAKPEGKPMPFKKGGKIAVKGKK